MAIGDTVQAGLMRVDSSPILLAGQAQAKANQAFGNAVGGVVEKFYQKKKDKQERDEREQAYLKMGLSSEEAKAASRDKDLANQFINKMNADQNYNLELNKFNLAKDFRDLQMDQIRQAMENKKTDRKADEISKTKDLEFNEGLLSQTTSPQAQREADMVAPGLPALGNAYARNRFMQAQLQQPQNQVPVSNLGSQDFGRFAREQGLDPTRSVQRMEALRKAELASQPKPMTLKEELDYIVKLNEELRNQAKANREASEFEEENRPMPPADPIYKEAAINAIDSAIEKSKSFFATGLPGQALQRFAGTDARDLAQAISTVEAAVGFDRLQEMRDSSKTGGALGAINTKELELLSNSLGSLDPLQKPETLRANLESIKNRYVKILKSVEAEKYAFENGITFKTPKEAMDFVDNFNASSPQQSANTIDPADLENAIQAKRKLLEQRKMMQQTLDNPNVPNYGPQ